MFRKDQLKSSTVYYTKSLFYEPNYGTGSQGTDERLLFTLTADRPGLINFGRAYVEDMDTTGYTTANRLLDGYPHFEALMKATWFREAKEDWDREIAARIAAESVEAIRKIANDPDNKNALAAAKFLAAKGHVDKTTARGRPSKATVDAAIQAEVAASRTLEEDLKRISNVVSISTKKG